MPRHSDNVNPHIPHFRTYPDEATREAVTSDDFEVGPDFRKWAYQESDDTLWVLIQITPSVVWKQLGGAGGGTPDLPFDAITDPVVNAAVTTAVIDLNSGTVITLTAAGNNQTLGAPTDTTAGRKFFVLNNDTSNNAITVNGVVLSPAQYVEFRWDGDTWLLTAGGSASGAGGFDTQVQFNKAGVIAGDASLTLDDINKKLKMIGDITQVSGEVGSPDTPDIISTTAVGTGPRNSTVVGSDFYVVDQDIGDLKIFDVTDPAAPRLLGSLSGLGACRGVDIGGSFVYVSSQAPNTLHIIDVKDKSTPVLKSSILLPASGSQRGVRVSGRTVFTTNNGAAQALTSIDVTDPENPEVLDSYVHTSGARTELEVANGVAFFNTASVNGNFVLIDVSDPSNLTLFANLDVGSTQWATKVQGPYAYVVGESNPSFQIFDVSNPGATTNVTIGSLHIPGSSHRALDVSGDFAYLVDAANNSVDVINVSDPTAPVLIGNVALGTNPVSITTVGKLGYITDNTDGNFSIVDFGGIEVQNLKAGNADLGDVNVRRNIKAAGLISAAAGSFGAEGVNSDGDIAARGRVLGGKPKNVVEVYKESDFPINGGELDLSVGTVYRLMAPIFTDKDLPVPDTGGAFTTTEIVSSNKTLNTLTSTGSGGAFLKSAGGQGQLIFRNLIILNTGSRVFADVRGATQTAVLIELDDTNVLGFDKGSVFDTCILNVNNESFLNDFGDFKVIDCECNWSDMFSVSGNFVDSSLPTIDVRSNLGTGVLSFLSIRDSKLSSHPNEAFFMLHSNLIPGSTIRINGIDASPFTPSTGPFFDTQSGSITSLQDSGGAPGVRTEVFSAGHNVADGDVIVQAGFTTETQMNGPFVASDVTTNSYEIVAVFSGTDTGTWTNASLDQKDPKVIAFGNPGQADSKAIGSYLVDGNAEPTEFAGNGVWTDLDLGGNVVAGSNIERFTLVNPTTGELRYDGIEPFSGNLSFDAYVTSSGGAQDFQMRAVKNGLTLPDTFEPKLNIGSDTLIFKVSVPVMLVTGDLVRPQKLRVSGTSSLTASHLAMSVQ